MLGTNGGGFFNVNSAHPFENLTPLSNFFEAWAIFAIPAALTYAFGRVVGNTRQGWGIWAAMGTIFAGFANLENERLRHSLVQALSHDLKTPLTVLTAQAEEILGRRKKEDIDGAFDETVELIKTSERMVRLVNNLLDMAKLQSGKFEPHLDGIPADELIGASLASMKAHLYDFRVQVKIADDCPMLYCDQTLLDRLLFNLLDNAAKYCPFGRTVVIEAALRGNAVMLSVSDNGPGFPTGDPQRLFAPFRRGHRESDITGGGLGLAICRSLARVHNADLLALPSSMGGASFVLMLPYVPLPPMKGEGEILGDEDLPSTVSMLEVTKKNKLPSVTNG